MDHPGQLAQAHRFGGDSPRKKRGEGRRWQPSLCAVCDERLRDAERDYSAGFQTAVPSMLEDQP